MEYTTLGRTRLKASVAGLGCGGSSRLGLAKGKGEAHGTAIVRQALDLGVNYIDTARFYGTEEAVGAGIRGVPRESVIVATKHKVSIGGRPLTADEVVAGLETSLRALGTDYVDVFNLHTVLPNEYERVATEVVPALEREREKGKFRFLGVTEFAGHDPRHEMLERALKDDCWDVVMTAFHMLSQNARRLVFPATRAKNVGAVVMFAVRALFSVPGRLQQDVRALAAEGRLPGWLAEKEQPLDFLLGPGGAGSVIEAAYRYARHEPGAHVVLFGTGDPAHVEHNVRAILQPPLPDESLRRIETLFGALVDVGLDESGHGR